MTITNIFLFRKKFPLLRLLWTFSKHVFHRSTFPLLGDLEGHSLEGSACEALRDQRMIGFFRLTFFSINYGYFSKIFLFEIHPLLVGDQGHCMGSSDRK